MDTHQSGKSLINGSRINEAGITGIGISNIIVTRPEGQQQELIAQLKAINNTQQLATKIPVINIMHLPLISIEPQHAEIKGLNFKSFKGIIFISKNAVKYLKSQLSERQWKSLLENSLYAIGEATASILKRELDRFEISDEVVFPNKATSESLLALNHLREIEEENWLIVKGVAGRNKLKAELTNRKAVVSELEVYKRNKPSNSVQKKIIEQVRGESKLTSIENDYSIWLISSAEGLKNFSDILNRESQELDSTRGCLVITTSDRITKVAENLGFTIIAQANNATDEALFSCVRTFVCKKFEIKSKLNSDRKT